MLDLSLLNTSDFLLVIGALLVTLYFTRDRLRTSIGRYDHQSSKSDYPDAPDTGSDDRNLVNVMNKGNYRCVVLYGSQTGTAEDLAMRLAKKSQSRFGLNTMVADMADYDYDDLSKLSSDTLVMLVMATYGEGEPTDNAAGFWGFVTSNDNDSDLSNLNFVAFGCGNKTYEYFNHVIRHVDKCLRKLNANRLCAVGEGDDAAATTEEDFLSWEETMWPALVKKMDLKEREEEYKPLFEVATQGTLSAESPQVYLGEPNKKHLSARLGEGVKGPYSAQNPYLATLRESRELCLLQDRRCLHIELDIEGSEMTYQTGDHVSLWPMNASAEVDRIVNLLGLTERRHEVISLKSAQVSTTKIPIPTPTTYDSIFRYYLEINAPVSRQFLATLAPFANNEAARVELTSLGGNKEYFAQRTSGRYYSIPRLLEQISGGSNAAQSQWSHVPFSIWIEGFSKLQPRNYSISSSSLVSLRRISITVAIDNKTPVSSGPISSVTKSGEGGIPFRGVTTNYLLAVASSRSGSCGTTYEVSGPRGRYAGGQVAINVRRSTFRLPRDLSKPVIMIGPGTGVAPFRAFVQERAEVARRGNVDLGHTILFYGCRKAEGDFLYKEEWKEHEQALGTSFELVTAFSRDSTKKVYVQHRLLERAQQVNNLLEKGAYIYICGDAGGMARDVSATLIKIVVAQRGISEVEAQKTLNAMRTQSRYQVRHDLQSELTAWSNSCL
ncbi:FAD binding domain-containing protein [Fusarium oxysporum II5]|uniref:NADPH--cytochrome P450 reductase n=3 Tax=Fusarium oxysporum species complex TaxID=171631 RepID=N1RUW8_FUSC4|nr:uncharacterized protein FOIG_15956 [Fusarium odoratissimum NRRL 54006]EMT69674.1 NADPH--cytochrome P450 reductase [Fusarium odoratissimum]EXL90853.1 hypothetical protein FOIG_15956 [Fusarium odoratissimum NRRL 54006]KAK2132166.1 FAD binding domain-containing protein [Fusarium oxysporum II5]TXC09307.1 hypothetical protein FocTR4_00006103 [Fusarium oxysporum f. sp. cubense]